MLSIGAFAKAAGISTRTVRHYESLGLIRATVRGENNYRFFERGQLGELEKIRDLQNLGFSLEEVKQVMFLRPENMTLYLQKRLLAVESELVQLNGCRERLQNLLSISQRVEAAQEVRLHERKMYMDTIKNMVLEGVRLRQGTVSEGHRSYLERERSLCEAPEKRAFVEAVRMCIQFARDHHLILGPGRGSCPASIVLYGLGFSGVDPTAYDLIPERLSNMPPDIHIDVEYERGQMFVDYCDELSDELEWGRITAFRMPLLNILANVHQKVGKTIDYDEISDDSELVLGNIRRAEIEKIFLFDYSPEALVMKHEGLFMPYVGTAKIKEYLLSQRIDSFRDVLNIISVWRPNHQEKIERAELYLNAKKEPKTYGFLSERLQNMLGPNYGRVIYHEDLIEIMAEYTGWPLDRCSKLKRDMRFGRAEKDLIEFRSLVSQDIFDLVVEEAPWTFCKSHVVAFGQFTKQTSVLKSLHPDIYLGEIAKWESEHGFVWDDIGIKIEGVELLRS